MACAFGYLLLIFLLILLRIFMALIFLPATLSLCLPPSFSFFPSCCVSYFLSMVYIHLFFVCCVLPCNLKINRWKCVSSDGQIPGLTLFWILKYFYVNLFNEHIWKGPQQDVSKQNATNHQNNHTHDQELKLFTHEPHNADEPKMLPKDSEN